MKSFISPSLLRPVATSGVLMVFLGTAHAASPSFTVRSKTSLLPSMTRRIHVVAPLTVATPATRQVKGGFRLAALATPTITSVTIAPTNARTNDTLIATVNATDADGDSLTYTYVWRRNGAVIAGETGPTLDLSKPGNGDKGNQINVTVTATDGTTDSAPVTSNTVTIANTGPSINTVTITPANPTTNTVLTANATGSDADGDAITFLYVWRKNGVEIPNEKGQTLDLSKPGNGDPGDVITVIAKSRDNNSNSAPLTSAPVTVQASANTAPTITSVTLTPSNPTTNAVLTTSVSATDADGNPLTFTYVYRKNGTIIAGQNGPTLNLATAGNGDKGDQITVTVTASDGTDSSAPVVSNTVTVANSGPVATTATITPANPTTNTVLTANATGTDADNDTLTFLYVWMKNGTVIPGETGQTLDLSKPGNGDKGDQITVEVKARDTNTNSAPLVSAPVTVINSLPTITSVTISPSAPTGIDTLTATVVATDADNDTLTYTYEWRKNGTPIAGETGPTLDLSKAGNGDDGDVITVAVIANDGSANSTEFVSPSVTVNNFLPQVVSVTPQNTTDKVSDKRTFTVTVSDINGPNDIKEIWLLINNRLNWGEGATFIYVPSASNPTNGLLYLRRGDAFLPPIQIGAGSSPTAVLDNGAVRVIGSEITVNVSGNSVSLNIPAVIRDGLVGTNNLYTRVVDRSDATPPGTMPDDMGFVNSGTYTVTPQFASGTNVAPTLSKLSPGATYTTLNAQGEGPSAQNFTFYVKDENGTGDIENVTFFAGKDLTSTTSATIVYNPRTRRVFLRSDDGSSFIGGGQVGSASIIENSQVRIDLSKVQVLIYNDGKSFGLRFFLQAKSGLLGQNKIWLRVQDRQGLTSAGGDAQGYVFSGTWSVVQSTTPTANAAKNPSNGNS